jgi:hypothetical protein
MQPRPVTNLDEPIGKIVGKRRPPASAADLQKTLNQVFKSQGHRLWPRGVYRFTSFQEADQWTMNMIRPKKAS